MTTRAVEEREWKKGELFEVAKDYYAICGETGDVLYFGEDVDYYEHGKVTRHSGSWRAEKGNRPGLVMPGKPRLNMKYYREIAPAAAMDQAEIVSLDETCLTPAGSFSNCMKIRETSPLDPRRDQVRTRHRAGGQRHGAPRQVRARNGRWFIRPRGAASVH